MLIKQIVTNLMSENAYVCIDGDEALICDPGGSADEIINALDGITPKYIILTHGHFDHILAVSELKKRTGAKIVISRSDSEMTEGIGNCGSDYGISVERFKADLFAEDTLIKIGSSVFDVINTPGHTKGSVCYLCEDVLLSGDTLFEGTIGKFDGKDSQAMKKSVMRLAALPENVQVFPGHGNATTIGSEKVQNPYFDERNWNFI